MKVKLTLYCLIFLFACSSTKKAQSISINGLEVGVEYTLEQIKKTLGNNPTEYSSWENESENGYGYDLNYGSDNFNFGFMGFGYFSLSTNKFSVSGLFRVGDAVSVLSNIKNSRMELKEEGCYHFYLGHADDPIVISFKDGVITSIWYMMSV